jgi:endonuclease YncB( thermonuclease family)
MMLRPFVASRIATAAAMAAAALLAACAMPKQAGAATTAGALKPVPVPGKQDAPVLAGSVTHVIDGDTLNIELSSGPITVRLASIDAPEHDQPGGAEATAALGRRLEGRQVEVAVEAQDQYERLVAIVHLGGENINSWMVQQGYAWAYRQYVDDPRYCTWEADARTSRRGLWGAAPGSPKAPWEWRRAQREGGAFKFTDYQRESVSRCMRAVRRSAEKRADAGSPQPPPPVASPTVLPAPATGECRIKGNISESGKIYHVPGDESYEHTRVNTQKGERWFCTEAEAQAAGWRAAR